MSDLRKQVEQFVKEELIKAGLEIFTRESENRGVDIIVKAPSRKYHELFLQPLLEVLKYRKVI